MWVVLGLPSSVHIGTKEMLSYRDGRGLFALKLANIRASRSHVSTGRCGFKVSGLTAVEVQYAEFKMSTLFSGHYLRNRSTLDIGVLGYIGIV